MSQRPPLPKTAVLEKARRSPRVVHVAQTVVIAMLVAAAFLFSGQIDGLKQSGATDNGRLTTVEAMLAQACDAANFAELKHKGIVEECRLAQAGTLPSAIPTNTLPSAGATSAPANVIPDDKNALPSDTKTNPLPGTPVQISAAVNAYFATHPIPITGAYARAVHRATAQYLTNHPPRDGHTPTTGEVSKVVRAVLVANPPPPGEDGAPGTAGVSITSATLDGCDVVFTYSDGTSNAVGPVCGPKGDTGNPSDQQVADAVAAYCQANGECRGPAGLVKVVDNCQPAPAGEFLTNVDASYDADTQTITLSCDSTPILGSP